jgi:hypothetical protein
VAQVIRLIRKPLSTFEQDIFLVMGCLSKEPAHSSLKVASVPHAGPSDKSLAKLVTGSRARLLFAKADLLCCQGCEPAVERSHKDESANQRKWATISYYLIYLLVSWTSARILIDSQKKDQTRLWWGLRSASPYRFIDIKSQDSIVSPRFLGTDQHYFSIFLSWI